MRSSKYELLTKHPDLSHDYGPGTCMKRKMKNDRLNSVDPEVFGGEFKFEIPTKHLDPPLTVNLEL